MGCVCKQGAEMSGLASEGKGFQVSLGTNDVG